jgi:hypothetical protein
MITAAECRAKVKEKITQATQDKRHRRKLLSAAEAWLFLAERLDESDHVTVASEVGDDFDTGLHRAVGDKAERCCRLAPGVNDTVATQRLGDLADEYTAEADKQAANERQ